MSQTKEVYAILFIFILIAAALAFIKLESPTGADTFQSGTATFNVIGPNATNLTITKTDSADPIPPGSNFTYFILINVTTGNATNITVYETYPAGISFISSEPAPISGNDTFFVGNLTTGQTFQINITVNVDENFTGILLNNVTATFNATNGTFQNASDTETTTVAIGAPPPTGGGTSGGGQQAGCVKKVIHQQQEYECVCFIQQYGKLFIQPTTCASNPTTTQCKDFCWPLIPPPLEYAAGTCPTAQTCGTLCCNPGEICSNGACTLTKPRPILLPPPPEYQEGGFLILQQTERNILSFLFLLLIALILVIIGLIFWATKPPKKAYSKRKKLK